jgi:trans-aconitate methyltransferase
VTRDTDDDWSVIAAKQPFFGVLANERFYMQNLTPDVKEEFYASGESDIDHVARTLAAINGGRFSPTTALDFGCGVGRLTFAMAKYAQAVVGVDVADAMLDVARRESIERGVSGVELRKTLPEGRVDWVNSLIVLQHIPPDRGHDILERLVQKLEPSGFLSIQLTFFRDSNHSAEVVRDLADYRYDGRIVEMLSVAPSDPGAMTMYDYDLNRVMRTLFTNGFQSVVAQHTDHAGCHGAWLFGVKV